MKNNNMAKLIVFLIGVAFVAGGIFLMSLISGTILYYIYPHIHVMFPTAAKSGIIAYELPWWDAVCVTWIFGILIKSTQTNTVEKKD